MSNSLLPSLCCSMIVLMNVPLSFSQIGVSVRLCWQIFTQGRAKKSSKIAPSGDWRREPPESSGQCATNWARQEICWAGDFWHELCLFMHHFTCWTSLISRVNRAWLYKPWRFRLATECWLSSVGRVLAWWSRGPGFNAHWEQFLTNSFLLFALCKDLSDHLSETPTVKNCKWNQNNWRRSGAFIVCKSIDPSRISLLLRKTMINIFKMSYI